MLICTSCQEKHCHWRVWSPFLHAIEIAENCAVGEWDRCRNGQYTERGIKQSDGYMSEHWRIEPDYAIKVDSSLGILGVLLEPTAVVAKAWEEVDNIGRRSFWEPQTVLITGVGPIGLLAALLGKERGMDVHVLGRAESGPKPELVRSLGATYHTGSVLDLPFDPDVVIECTGVGPLINDVIQKVGSGGIVCLTGVGAGGPASGQITANVATDAVLKNKVVVGSVNANKRHWHKGREALARADRNWLSKLISRREKPESYASALERKRDDIKVVIQFASV